MAIRNYLQLCFLILCIGRIFAELNGNPCTLENNETGSCKLLVDCPPRLAEARLGKRNAQSSRCGFRGFEEIVCCPTELKKINEIRPANSVCHQYLTNVWSGTVDIRILNGIEASSQEFPYAVALGYRDDSQSPVIKIDYKCGGTIITETFVLTAAHCVSNIHKFVPILVRAGAENLSENEGAQTVAVAEIIKHPKHRISQIYNDVALLRLSSKFNWTLTVKPICMASIPIEEIDLSSSVKFVAIGWGFTEIDGPASDKLLQTPNLELVRSSDCNRSYEASGRFPNGIDATLLCARDKNLTRRGDTCHGDSGGPLLMMGTENDTIIGITSFGEGCGSPMGGIYTSVYRYLDWIEAIVWPNLYSDWNKRRLNGFSPILHREE